ncbi:MAG TPA: hypothetical protein VJ438_01200 [Candidatus Nanoarchaeia archaeon]|nr:hypothetical protein [Candidatus Nanoarchaeia archaeon]
MENKGFSNESIMIENNKKTCEYDEIELDNDNYNSFNYTDFPFEIEIIISKE